MSSSKKDEPTWLIIGHWNMCSSPCFQPGGRYFRTYGSELSVGARWAKIVEILDKLCAEMDVLSLLEIEQTEMLPRLVAYFAERHRGDWSFRWVPYADAGNADSSFVYGLAWFSGPDDSPVVSVESLGRRALTTSGTFLTPEQRAILSLDEQRAHNLNRPSPSSVVGYAITTTRNESQTPRRMELWQMHPGTDNRHKELAFAMMLDIVRDRLDSAAAAAAAAGSGSRPVVMLAGDDNGFDKDCVTPKYNDTMRHALRDDSLERIREYSILRKHVTCSTDDLIARSQGSYLASFCAFHPDCAGWYMTADERAEEERLLLDDPDCAGQCVRTLHERVIERANDERFGPREVRSRGFIRTPRCAESEFRELRHSLYPSVQYTLVLDEAYLWNASMYCALWTEAWGASDHACLVTHVAL